MDDVVQRESSAQSRRAFLGRGVGGAVAGSALLATAAKAEGPRDRLKPLVAQFFKDWESRDRKAMLDRFADNGRLLLPEGMLFGPADPALVQQAASQGARWLPPYDKRDEGVRWQAPYLWAKPQIANLLEKDAAAFPRIKYELSSLIEEGSKCGVEGAWRTFDTPGDQRLPSVRESVIPFCGMFEFSGDKILVCHLQYDMLHWLGADYAMSGARIEAYVNSVRRRTGLPLMFGEKG